MPKGIAGKGKGHSGVLVCTASFCSDKIGHHIGGEACLREGEKEEDAGGLYIVFATALVLSEIWSVRSDWPCQDIKRKGEGGRRRERSSALHRGYMGLTTVGPKKEKGEGVRGKAKGFDNTHAGGDSGYEDGEETASSGHDLGRVLVCT